MLFEEKNLVILSLSLSNMEILFRKLSNQRKTRKNNSVFNRQNGEYSLNQNIGLSQFRATIALTYCWKEANNTAVSPLLIYLASALVGGGTILH